MKPVVQHGAIHPMWSQLYNMEPVHQHGASHTTWSQFLELVCTFMNQLSNMEPLAQHGDSYTTWGQLYNMGPVIQFGILGLSQSNAALISTYGTCGIYE